MSQGYQPRRQHGVVSPPPRKPSAPAHSLQERQVIAMESIAASLAAIVSAVKAAQCQ